MGFGIYALVFPKAEILIGSTTRSFDIRFQEHLNGLRRGNHGNFWAQRLYMKYGEPRFEILEECFSTCGITFVEQAWIDGFQGILINLGPAFPSTSFGKTFSPEHRQKISEAGKGRVVSLESRKKLSEANLGKILSLEHRQKVSETLKVRGIRPPSAKGKILSPEHRQKLSEANKGRKKPPCSEEHRQKLSEAKKGYSTSLEIRRKISESMMGKNKGKILGPLSEEHRQKLSEANLGRIFTEEHRQKLSEALKRKHPSEETRKRMSEAQKARRKLENNLC